jgi:hypothetical protein
MGYMKHERKMSSNASCNVESMSYKWFGYAANTMASDSYRDFRRPKIRIINKNCNAELISYIWPGHTANTMASDAYRDFKELEITIRLLHCSADSIQDNDAFSYHLDGVEGVERIDPLKRLGLLYHDWSIQDLQGLCITKCTEGGKRRRIGTWTLHSTSKYFDQLESEEITLV